MIFVSPQKTVRSSIVDRLVHALPMPSLSQMRWRFRVTLRVSHSSEALLYQRGLGCMSAHRPTETKSRGTGSTGRMAPNWPGI